MKYWLGVTDTIWFNFLKAREPEDVNFWQPSGRQTEFAAIEKGAPLLFKLKAPYNAIGGLGFYSTQAFLPVSVAWDAFGFHNGCASNSELKNAIDSYRKKNKTMEAANPIIGCLILTNLVFFDEADWIPVPENWKGPIVQGKTYSDEEPIGARLWDAVEERLQRTAFASQTPMKDGQLMIQGTLSYAPRYRESVLSRVRVGQGTFRIMVTEAYQSRCAITGEHTLPVLEAAHIQPYSESGPHVISNGILLRSDLHKLFDTGYITITEDLRLEVSSRIREEYDNGKIYYAMAGQKPLVKPEPANNQPNRDFIRWHNEKVYKAS